MPTSNVSVVVPVYNAEDHLRACLDALAKQTVPPLEVIVVDNNSTDKSSAVAGKYSFAKVINEKRRGVLYARYSGFSEAKAEIIASIDSDTRMPEDWVEKVSRAFDNQQVDALSGGVYFYDLIWPGFFNSLDRVIRNFVSRRFKASSLMQGTNMAFRKAAFDIVKNDLCWREDLQEDNDIAIHLHKTGAKVIYAPNIVAGVSVSRSRLGFMSTVRYYSRLPKTFKAHDIGQLYLLYLVVIVISLSYWPVFIAHLIYSSRN